MNTWFTEIIKNSNESSLNDFQLERIMVYYHRLPTRLRAAESIERLEVELMASLQAELKSRFPDRSLYARKLVVDILESLRHMVLAMLADEPRLFRVRWVDHLTQVVRELDLDPVEIRDVYEVIREMMTSRLNAQSCELMEPYFGEVIEALTPASISHRHSPTLEYSS